MSRVSRLVIALFVLMTALSLVSPGVSEWIALGLMICAGIPHGSYDLRIAKLKWHKREISPIKVAAIYLACVFSMSALCIFLPSLGLAIFIAISAFHFSEGEYQSDVSRDLLSSVLLGIGAIIIPIGLHTDRSIRYIGYFVESSAAESFVPTLRLVALFLVAILVLIVIRDWSKRCHVDANTIERSICLICWILLPPLAGFCVWFIGRHSRQHLEICSRIFRQRERGMPTDFVLISLLAIAGLIPFSFAFDFSDINQLFAASICLIAGLTLPHMIVSHGIGSEEKVAT